MAHHAPPHLVFFRHHHGAEGSGGLRENISAFGNPAVWWLGIPAGVYMVFRALFRKDRTAAFLPVGYCAQHLPWSLISRPTFIYHYFPGADAGAQPELLEGQALQAGTVGGLHRLQRGSLWPVLLFYPILAGQAVDAAFITEKLRWLDSWVLTLE